MKKIWMIVPAMLALAACGGSGETTTTSGSTGTTTTTPTTPVGPVTADVTINVTVSGIDTYEGGHAFIWINTDALGSASAWGSAKLTQDTTDQNKWSVVIPDFELEQAITYNFYYGNETTPDWINGKNVIEGDSQTIVTEEGTTSYDVAATFHVPTVTGQVNVRYSVNPKVVTTNGGAEEDITDGNYIWAWNNLDDDTVKLEKQLDGTWLYAKDNVDLLDDKVTVQLSCVLGSSTAPNWEKEGDVEKYKQGAWESGSWVVWDNIHYDFTSTEVEHTDNIFFKQEPDVVTGPTLTIKYIETNETTFWGNSRWLEASYTKTDAGVLNDIWPGNLTWDEELNGYKNVYQYTGDVNFNIGIWKSDDLAKAFVGASLTKAFHVTFTADVAEVVITATITDTGTDPILIVGEVTSTTGCTVE